MKKVLRKILYILSRSETLSKISSKIRDYNRNENNCDIETNGEAHFIEEHKDNFEIVFDVGANIGEWSNYIHKIKPNCTVYSFEPSKGTFETLKGNIKIPEAKIFNIGLGEKKETLTFYNYGTNSTLNSAIKRDGIRQNETKELVEFDTVDNFCEENSIDNISFLKIDVEGNELNVLLGAKEMIRFGKINYIQFEYGGTYIDAKILLKDVFSFFNDKPYKIHKIMQKGLKEIKEYDQSLENFQYSNYIAILNHDNS